MDTRSKYAFTLVEALFGIVILGIVSTGSWYAVNTLFHTGALTQSRNEGINLLQKSQEEVRKTSRSFFDSLNNCQFPGPSFNNSNTTCGLSDISANFPGYSRSLSVSAENGSTELKKAVITVEWDEFNQHKSMQGAVLIARPPDPFPGNIYGAVRSCKDNTVISGASLTVTNLSGSFTRTFSPSLGTLDAKSANYDFKDAATGHFTLPVDTYTLKATHSKFKTYDPKIQKVVGNSSEVYYPFCMVPNPSDAKITVKLVNAADGNKPLLNFNNPGNSSYYGWIYLFDDGNTPSAQSVPTPGIPRVSTATFTIQFTDNNPKVFTVNTVRAFNAGWAYKNTTVTGGFGPCAYHYSPEGWSSSLVQSDGSETCGNPYQGSVVTDRISVSPGEIDKVVVVPLVPVPTATIYGKVVDSKEHKGIKGAQILAKWPTIADYVPSASSRVPINWISVATTDENGDYSYTVPAVQELFADTNPDGYLKVQATGSVKIKQCCDNEALSNVSSPVQYVGPLWEGNERRNVDFVLPVADQTCGNAEGRITDGLTGLGINSSVITIQGATESSDTSGDYKYECNNNSDDSNENNKFRLPVGNSAVLSSKANYYSFTSAGNKWYSRNSGVTILSAQMVDYNAKLWPMATGDLEVNVTSKNDDQPIENATVDLLTYNDGKHTLKQTGTDGKALFSNVQETWPPIDLPADSYYNHAASTHTITITPPVGSRYLAPTSSTSTSVIKNQKSTLTIPLDSRKGI